MNEIEFVELRAKKKGLINQTPIYNPKINLE